MYTLKQVLLSTGWGHRPYFLERDMCRAFDVSVLATWIPLCFGIGIVAKQKQSNPVIIVHNHLVRLSRFRATDHFVNFDNLNFLFLSAN